MSNGACIKQRVFNMEDKQMSNFTDLKSCIQLIKEITGATKVSITLEFPEKVSTPKETISEQVKEIIPPKEETRVVEEEPLVVEQLPETPVSAESDKEDDQSGEWLTIREIESKYNIGYLTARTIAKTLESRVQNRPHSKGRDPLVYNVSPIHNVDRYLKLNSSSVNNVPDGYIPVSELAKIMGLSKGYLFQYLHKNQLHKHMLRVKRSYYCNEAEIRKYRAEQERYADKHGGNIVHKYC